MLLLALVACGDVSGRLDISRVQLDAGGARVLLDVDLHFSPTHLEALDHGVPLRLDFIVAPLAGAGTVESIVQDTVQRGNAAAATIGGAVIGGLLGNQIGGGSGQTAATIVGAGGGAFVGNQAAQRQTLVWRIGVRYDDGSLATIQQTTAPAVRIGDRVRVTGSGIELLRQGPN